MKKIVIDATTVKNLLDALTPFKGAENSIRFEIGSFAKASGQRLASKAILTNGGSQVEKLFFVNKPSDFVEGSIYTSFNLKAADTQNILSALQNYEKNITFTLSDDEAKVTLSIPNITEISLNTVLSEELEPALPSQEDAIMVKVETTVKKLQQLIKKGAGLMDAKKRPGISDRIAIRITAGKIEMLSTDTFSVEQAWTDANIEFNGLNIAMKALKEHADTLPATEKKKLIEKMKAAGKEGVAAIVKEENLDIEKLSIALSYANFPAFCSMLKGEETVQLMIAPKYVYVLLKTEIASFALAGTVNQVVYNVIDKYTAPDYPFRVEIDKAELIKGLNLLEATSAIGALRESNLPTKLFVSNGNLIAEMGNNKVTTKIVAATDDAKTGFKDCFLNGQLLKSIAAVQEGANLTLCMTEDYSAPVILSTGGIDCQETSAKAVILRVKGESAPTEKEDTPDKE